MALTTNTFTRTGYTFAVLLEEDGRGGSAELHSLQVERGIKTLMVSSAVPQEGKTLTITNLALQ